MLSSRPIQPVEQPGTPQVSRGVRRPRRVFRPPRRRLTPSCHAGWRNRLLPLVIGPAVGRHRPGHSLRARERAVGGLTTLASRPQVSDFTAGQFEWWGSREGGRHLRAAPPPHDKFRAVPGSVSWWGREEGDGSLFGAPHRLVSRTSSWPFGELPAGHERLRFGCRQRAEGWARSSPSEPLTGLPRPLPPFSRSGIRPSRGGQGYPFVSFGATPSLTIFGSRASAVDGTARVSPRYSRGERAVGVL